MGVNVRSPSSSAYEEMDYFQNGMDRYTCYSCVYLSNYVTLTQLDKQCHLNQ